MNEMNSEYALELKGITKRFSALTANDNVTFAVRKGEIHALSGENGAGKTTLMNVIFGLLQPDEGEIFVNGKLAHFKTPREANKAGIGMVHQHFMLIPKLTVTENVIIGQEPMKGIRVDRGVAERRVQEISDRFGLRIDAKALVSDLSVPEQQRVEIIKVLYRKADILIFDEPTAVLTPHLIDEFCDILLGLKKQGKTIIFISHKLAEVMKVSDSVTVLRRGKVIGTKSVCDITVDDLTNMMVGHSIDTGRKGRAEMPKNGDDILSISNLSYTNIHGNKKLDDFSISVKAGEIMGIAGVDGNGQEELEKCILGLYQPESGEICIKGKNVNKLSIKERKEIGVGYVAEDRQRESLVMQYSVEDNLILGQQRRKEFSKMGFWLKKDAIAKHATTLQKDYDIRCASTSAHASTLSGGNQQKIVIAREASSDPELYVAIQPTRGLDIGASDSVQDKLIELRNHNKSCSSCINGT
jgi:ABC-type uncharacterized transport systems, ATPase components